MLSLFTQHDFGAATNIFLVLTRSRLRYRRKILNRFGGHSTHFFSFFLFVVLNLNITLFKWIYPEKNIMHHRFIYRNELLYFSVNCQILNHFIIHVVFISVYINLKLHFCFVKLSLQYFPVLSCIQINVCHVKGLLFKSGLVI